MLGLYESISALAKKVNRLCCAVKILQENSSAGEVGSPIFQPDIITYSGTSAAGVAVDMQDYAPIVFWSRQISAPNLIDIYGTIYIEGSGSYGESILNTISMPSLQTVGSLISPTDVTSPVSILIRNFNYLSTIDFGSLQTVESVGGSSIEITDLISLTSLDLSNLTSIENTIEVRNCPLLTTLNLQSLQSVDNGDITFTNNALTTLNISSLTTFGGTYFDATFNNLTQSSIDAILYQLANVVNFTNGFVVLDNGTNAAPSATGDTYVATLVANGCTVTTN